VIAVLAAAVALAAQAAAPLVSDDCLITIDAISHATPRFEDYSVPAETVGTPAPVDLASHPAAREFRTQIRSDARAGPNFAGHFTIVGWGCGAPCLQWGVVDARTGKVWFEPTASVVDANHVGDEGSHSAGVNADFYNLRFRLDSRLLIVLGAPQEDVSREGASFYLWDGARFSLLKFIPRKEACRETAR